MSERERLDVLLVRRGLAESRERAQAMIRAGDVSVAGQREDKPGTRVDASAAIALRERSPWVGRGALKLIGALEAFGLPVEGAACLDVGASTGGFTQALLAQGARHVYAVDVGRNQLAWRLRSDPRVTSLERTDIRALAPLPEPIAIATVDVAFISLTTVLPALAAHLAADGHVVALVKPQFEAGRARLGKGGIVRTEALRLAVLREVAERILALGWRVVDAVPSPIAGAEGNREVFVHLRLPGARAASLDADAIMARASGTGSGSVAGAGPDSTV